MSVKLCCFFLVSRSKQKKTLSQECELTHDTSLVIPEWGRYNYPHSGVHPRKLTDQRKSHHLKMYSLWKIGIFQCHVSFQGCNSRPEINPSVGNPNEETFLDSHSRNSTDSPESNPEKTVWSKRMPKNWSFPPRGFLLNFSNGKHRTNVLQNLGVN